MTALYIAIALLAVFGVYLFLIFPRSSKNAKHFCVNYAHRGLYGGSIPENTLAAFENAASHGFGIELDVQLTSDKRVAVMHDYTTGRMCGESVHISKTSMDELKKLKIGGTDERIPELSEVLATVRGRVPLLIELKGETSDDRLCGCLHEALSGYKGEYCVESFNPLLLRGFARYEPDTVRGILSCRLAKSGFKNKPLGFALQRLLLNFLCRPDFVAYRWDEASGVSLKLCTLLKAKLFLWSPKGEKECDEAQKRCDAIIFEEDVWNTSNA